MSVLAMMKKSSRIKWLVTVSASILLTGCPETVDGPASESVAPTTRANCVVLIDWGQWPPEWWTGVEKDGLYERCDKFMEWHPPGDDACQLALNEDGEALMVEIENAPNADTMKHTIAEDKCVGTVVGMRCTKRNCSNVFDTLDLHYQCSTRPQDRKKRSCDVWRSLH